MPALLSPQKAADYLGIGRTKLLALAKAKRLQTKRLDGRIYFLVASLDAFLKSLPSGI